MADTPQLCPNCFAGKPATALCPRCGFAAASNPSSLWLPAGTLVHDEYVIGRALGKPGGFGITYLAWERTLEVRVAIKEYLPRDLAGRITGSGQVQSHSEDEEVAFRYGLEQFLREARTLAMLDHPNIVRVRRFFEENGTAYLVMDYWEGSSVAALLEQRGKLPENEAVALMVPILDALEYLHGRNLLHRDIKPANLYLKQDRTPILLDFGAARWALGERTQSLSVLLSPGYSAFEQYHAQGAQGAWTDVYGATATLYRMLTGTDPPDATGRLDNDTLIPAQDLVPGISPALAGALARGLAPRRANRAQTAAELRWLLTEPVPVAEPRLEDRVQVAEPASEQAATAPQPDAPEAPRDESPATSRDEIPATPRAELQEVPASQDPPQAAAPSSLARPAWMPPLPAVVGVVGVAVAIALGLAVLRFQGVFEKKAPVPDSSRSTGADTGTDLMRTDDAPEKAPVPDSSQSMGADTGTNLMTTDGTSETAALVSALVADSDATRVPVAPSLRPVWLNEKDGLRYAWIPAGEFQMGCVGPLCSDDELPRHTVKFAKGFWLGTTVVTVAAYRRYTIASGGSMPKSLKRARAVDTDPITGVSWSDAQSFCWWAGGRLPSEAEWEYAARGGHEGRKYPWGNEKLPTGPLPANSFGVYEIVSDIEQWCKDNWHGTYVGAPTDGTAWLSRSATDHLFRSGYRSLGLPISDRTYANVAHSRTGIRCARDSAP
jgi:formylglycine-generating enzyme required for sulfatase activity/serine/threonine protein kinase